MKRSFLAYQRVYLIVSLIVALIFHVKVIGRENIPAGAAIICANHSSWADPFLIMTAIRNKEQLHMMAKKELFDFKPLGAILRGIGSFPVNRESADITAVKNTMNYLKEGEKVVIFPEGTRVDKDLSVRAKNGAVRIADKMKVPILPIYIPRRKKTFGKVEMVIGKPYYVNEEGLKLSNDEYNVRAQQMMEIIAGLKTGSAAV